MINNERLESLRRGREVSKFAMETQKERDRIIPFFRDFMESAYWNIPEPPDGCDEAPKFTRTDMFRAFMYGAREAGHLYQEADHDSDISGKP